MKITPLMFKPEMVRALLDGRKTQTRRIANPQPVANPRCVGGAFVIGKQPKNLPSGVYHFPHGVQSIASEHAHLYCRYGSPGDLIYVRERFAKLDDEIVFAADCSDADLATEKKLRREFPGITDEYPGGRWKPSIHMPRASSRLTLRLTGVRVERLNEISQQDCIAEGIPAQTGSFVHHVVADYQRLWNEINGAGSWEKNPFVWVLAFTVIKENVDKVAA